MEGYTTDDFLDKRADFCQKCQSMTRVDKSLGKRIRHLRIERSLTQSQLAGTEYSIAYVSRIESGERTPSPEALALFAGRLGISPDSLLAPIDAATLVHLEDLALRAEAARQEFRWDDATGIAQEYGTLARGLGSAAHEADALRVLGEVQEYNGDLEQALTLFEQALALRAAEHVSQRVELLIRVARVHRRTGDLGTSCDVLERAISELGGDAALYPHELSRLHLNLSATCHERGDSARACRLGLQGIEFAHAAGDRVALASALWAAAPPMAAADPARALSLIRRAGTLYAELGLTFELGRLHVQMGVVAQQSGDLSTARTALDRAEELLAGALTASARSTILLTRAEIALQEGDRGEAARLAQEVVALAEGVEPLEQARARRVLGEARSSQDPEAAEWELRAAIELFTSAGAQMDAARCFRSLGELLISIGRSDEALTVFRDGLGAVEGAA